VRWATNAAATLGHSVQYRIGMGTVHQWKSNTTAKWATFTGSHNHTYYFRAVTIKDATHRSYYSPWSKVVVH
jgi:hypothetical protein